MGFLLGTAVLVPGNLHTLEHGMEEGRLSEYRRGHRPLNNDHRKAEAFASLD